MPTEPVEPTPNPYKPRMRSEDKGRSKTPATGPLYGAALGMTQGMKKPPVVKTNSKAKIPHTSASDKQKAAMQRAAQMRLQARNKVK